MNRCEFVSTDVPGEYRCRRCGAERASAHSPQRIHRWCNAIDLASAAAPTETARGLGDTLASVVDVVTLGQGHKLATAIAQRLGRSDCGCDSRRGWLNRAVPYRQADRIALDQSPSTLLLRMPHGLGDAVQMTVVLRHLRHYHPEWTIDVAAKIGAHTLFAGLCRQAYVLGTEPTEREYTAARTLVWNEPDACYADSPATKAERCLREVFHLSPIEALCRSEIQVGVAARGRARDYLYSITGGQHERFSVVVFHYQGNSAAQQKTLDEELIARLVRRTLDRGFVPLVLDWDRRSRLAAMAGVHCPGADHPLWNATGTGDGETLAALIDQSAAMLAIDSGPGHIAGATGTPTLVVWSGHHPLQFYGLAPHVRHAVPVDHASKLRGGQADALAYFERSYNYRLYADPRRALPGMFDELLDEASGAAFKNVSNEVANETAPSQAELTLDTDLWVRRAHLTADRTIVRDVYWEDCYGVDRLPWQPRYVVDIGAHLGAFACRVRPRLAAEARVVCVEADPRNLTALARNVGGFAQIVPAACTYAPDPIRLRSTVYAGTENSGASTVDSVGEIVPRVTLEELFTAYQLPWIDVLKLDCEGCELSVLEHTLSLDRVRLIVGEWHDRERFLRLVARRFTAWRLQVLRDGALGLFWLENHGQDGAITMR